MPIATPEVAGDSPGPQRLKYLRTVCWVALRGSQISLVFSVVLQYKFSVLERRGLAARLPLFFFMTIHNESEKDQDWRKLCELVAREQDPHRLSELVDQLIKKLDARRRELRSSDQEAAQGKLKNN